MQIHYCEEGEKLYLNMTASRLATLVLVYFVRIQDCLHTKSLEKGKNLTRTLAQLGECSVDQEIKSELNKQLGAGNTAGGKVRRIRSALTL